MADLFHSGAWEQKDPVTAGVIISTPADVVPRSALTAYISMDEMDQFFQACGRAGRNPATTLRELVIGWATRHLGQGGALCEYCGREFRPVTNRARFCGRDCQVAAYHARKKADAQEE